MKSTLAVTVVTLFFVSVYTSPTPQTTKVPWECRKTNEPCSWIFNVCCEGFYCPSLLTNLGNCTAKTW
ncbi:hypothetical protein OPQ81_000574 [Rhizoctonia solani]|nr:hypothetical protein OPQ81_000574 [Rhizoctonia solani]